MASDFGLPVVAGQGTGLAWGSFAEDVTEQSLRSRFEHRSAGPPGRRGHCQPELRLSDWRDHGGGPRA